MSHDDLLSKWQERKGLEAAASAAERQQLAARTVQADETSRMLRETLPKLLRASKIPVTTFPARLGFMGTKTPAPGWLLGDHLYSGGPLPKYAYTWLTSGGLFQRIDGDNVQDVPLTRLSRDLLGPDADHLYRDADGSIYSSRVEHGDQTVPRATPLDEHVLRILERAERFAKAPLLRDFRLKK